MEESEKRRNFLCILKVFKTENHSVHARIVSKFIHLTVNCMVVRIVSSLSSDYGKERGTWHTFSVC